MEYEERHGSGGHTHCPCCGRPMWKGPMWGMGYGWEKQMWMRPPTISKRIEALEEGKKMLEEKLSIINKKIEKLKEAKEAEGTEEAEEE